jgi:hypothetical protein
MSNVTLGVLFDKTSRPGASVHRWRLIKRESFRAVLNCKAKGGIGIASLPPSASPQRSVSADRRWIAQQKVARAAECVVRVSRLSHWRTRIEVVILVARRTAAAAWASARRGAGATIIVDIGRALPVLAQARLVILVTPRMLVTIAAPIRRAARRAIVRSLRIPSTLAAVVAIEHATVTAWAIHIQVAAPSARIVGDTLTTPARPWRMILNHHVTRLTTATVRIAERLTAFRTHRLAAHGRR